jgi:hypothetical protein
MVHFLGKEMDSNTATISGTVNCLEAFSILVVSQGERESTGGSDLTMH